MIFSNPNCFSSSEYDAIYLFAELGTLPVTSWYILSNKFNLAYSVPSGNLEGLPVMGDPLVHLKKIDYSFSVIVLVL